MIPRDFFPPEKKLMLPHDFFVEKIEIFFLISSNDSVPASQILR